MVFVGMLLVGCINGIRSAHYNAMNGIGSSLPEIITKHPKGTCIISNRSYRKDGFYFFATSLCGSDHLDNYSCIIYNKVDASGVVVDAWVDEGISKLWGESGDLGGSSLHCDESILNGENRNWKTWISTDSRSSGSDQGK